jgi:predicted bacteriocin transport accessory protein
MNKKAIIIALLSFAIIIVGFLIYYVSLPKEYIQITYEEYKQLEESDEKFVLFIGASTCSHCTTYKKTINRVVKDYHIKVYYIDINLLEEEEHAHIYSHFPYSGTPTTVVIKNGKEYKREKTRIKGTASYEETVKKFKTAGIIK